MEGTMLHFFLTVIFLIVSNYTFYRLGRYNEKEIKDEGTIELINHDISMINLSLKKLVRDREIK